MDKRLLTFMKELRDLMEKHEGIELGGIDINLLNSDNTTIAGIVSLSSNPALWCVVTAASLTEDIKAEEI